MPETAKSPSHIAISVVTPVLGEALEVELVVVSVLLIVVFVVETGVPSIISLSGVLDSLFESLGSFVVVSFVLL